MLRWSSSSATLWLWQLLSAVFARHTLVAFQCFCGHSSQPRGYYDAFADARQAALRWESGCSAGRRRSVAIIAAGLGCEDMLTRHVAALVFLPCVSVTPCGSVLVLRGGTPGGCCAWGCCAWGQPSKVTCGRVTKTHAAISFFNNFSGYDTRWLFAPLL